MNLREHIAVAFDSIRANMVRSVITSLIIALGIIALVGVLTSVDGIKSSINQKFSEIGANSFTLTNRSSNVNFGGRKSRKYVNNTAILYREALEFKKAFPFESVVSIHASAFSASTVKYESYKTDPNVGLEGVDEHYLEVAGYSLSKGRNFTATDLQLNNNFCLIGSDV
ncbi:MAG: ABC transporter permease, partial [Bacteroidota bacterium]|nr:ABC transporter permease [Bacteroidota bacterium]MDX5429800.1 ABC transporter permease [Bacteroidota bacterium]MDX5468579.1 ABC transporter permease [Bacteroidota bacterium]